MAKIENGHTFNEIRYFDFFYMYSCMQIQAFLLMIPMYITCIRTIEKFCSYYNISRCSMLFKLLRKQPLKDLVGRV